MQTNITSGQIAAYRRDGFLVLERFLDLPELRQWREVTREAVRQRLEQRSGMTNQDDPDSFYANVFTQCVRLADTSPEMKEIIYDSRLAALAGALAGVDGIRIWHDQALFKEPYGNPTAWHLDNPYWSFYSPQAISVWVALDDATLENGCLWYLPGTHKEARFEGPGIGHNMADLFKVYPQWRKLEAVPAPCPAGGAVFHNGLTAHAAGANMTNTARRAMTCGYMPEGSTFNGQRNVLRQDLFERLQPGDVLDDEQQNPLVWSRRSSS